MSENTQVFAYDSHAIRMIQDEDGEPWFVAADVCTVLGYKNVSESVSYHCREAGVAKRYIRSGGQEREVVVIDEGNIYRLTIKSHKPEAKPFEARVCDEVLPAIRKTGRYTAPGAVSRRFDSRRPPCHTPTTKPSAAIPSCRGRSGTWYSNATACWSAPQRC